MDTPVAFRKTLAGSFTKNIFKTISTGYEILIYVFVYLWFWYFLETQKIVLNKKLNLETK